MMEKNNVPFAMQYKPTVSQQLIWLDQAISENSSKYNIGGYAVLEGELSYDVFNKAVNSSLVTQEAYASVFQEVQGTLTCRLQEIAQDEHMEIIDFSSMEDPSGEAIAWMENDFAGVFVMENSYLYTFKLLKIGHTKHYWYARIHHLIADGWSFRLLLNQTAAFYDRLINDMDPQLTVFRYSDYALDDEAYYQSSSMAEDRDYWLKEYKSIPPELFRKLPRMSSTARDDNSETLYLTAGTKQAMQEMAKEHKISLFHLVMGLLLVYFSRTRSQREIVMGVPVLNRTKKIYRSTAGVFMNLLSLKFEISDDDTFLQVLAKIKHVMSVSLRHQRYQYGNLVNDLQLPLSKLLYDVRVSYEDFDFSSSFGSLKSSAVALSNRAEKDKLAIYLRDYNGQGFDVRLVYDTAYFDRNMIVSICRSLEHMIAGLSSLGEKKVKEIGLLDEAQEREILTLTTGPIKKAPEEDFLTYWQNNVYRYGDHIALTCSTGNFTYRQVNARATTLSKILLHKRQEGHSRVALLLPRNEHMITGMLGSLMSGLTYIPLDQASPQRRIEQVLEDAACRLVVTAGSEDDFGPDRQTIDILSPAGSTDTGVREDSLATPTQNTDHPCYIIYTSGTTGLPKGVVISRSSLEDYISTFTEYFGICRQDVVLQQASPSFDTSVEEIYPVLAAGGRVCIAPDRRDIEGILLMIRSEQVSVVSTSPHVVKYLNDHGLPRSVRVVISGGDVLKAAFIRHLMQQGIPVFNTYGPTESTVCATYHRVTEQDDPISIGTPIPNREVYILDDHLQLQPPGVEGDIFLGGAGLSTGYLNDHLLTEQRFIRHPFRSEGRIYRTGDRGILQGNGEIMFAGRKDEQLNYRGYRIEAAEVESVIFKISTVENCLVTIGELRHTPVLIAYIEYGAEDRHSLKEWRQMMRQHLPAYMIPELWITVEKWPLSTGGKVDKRLLPAVGETPLHAPHDHIVSMSDEERMICQIWEDLLGQKIESAEDSFFESGGHSLNVGQLANRYDEKFGVRLSVRELFLHVTVAAHAQLIRQKEQETSSSIEKAPDEKDYAVSDGQRRLWLLSQLQESPNAYYLDGQLWLDGEYDPGRLEQAIRAVQARHEILRTVFRENGDGELRQVILTAREVLFTLGYRDLRDAPPGLAQEYIRDQAAVTLDPGQGPLLRAGLIRMEEQRYLFHYTMHHIISDGWSMELLGKEILEYEEALRKGVPIAPRPLRLQYRDYAIWQQARLADPAQAAHRAYWLRQLSGELPVLEMPSDHRRLPVRTQRGYLWQTTIDRQLTEGLRALCRRNESTLFMGLLGVLNTLCMLYTGQEDMIIGTVAAGRTRPELEEQIGYYVNTLPLRTICSREDRFTQLLQHIRFTTLSAYEHQDYPFDRLISDLGLKKDLSRSPLFDILLMLQNQHDEKRSAAGLNDSSPEKEKAVMFDLVFDFWEIDGELQLRLEFNMDIFSLDNIVRLAEHYKSIMAAVISVPDCPVGQIDYLTPTEKKLVLKDFNETMVPYPTGETIVSLFADQVRNAAAQAAVIFSGRALTYGELDTQSDRLARLLLSKGIGEETMVPLCIERSADMIVGILGILKAGAAYVPVDPAYPAERISYIFSDTKAEWVVTRKRYSDAFGNIGKIYLDDADIGLVEATPGPLPEIQPCNLAYVIYTSGSTGLPKGVMIEHASVINLARGQATLLDLHPGMRTLQFSSFGFDASCYEIFNTLLSRGTLVIPSGEELLSVELFSRCIKDNNVQLAVLPPSFYSALKVVELSPLTTVVSAGEPLNIAAAKAMVHGGIRVINAYGPTEITVCASLSGDPILEGDRVTIGRPIPNTSIYILDPNMKPVPTGITGELYIGGSGLARGYLNNPLLTGSSFVPDIHGAKDSKLYKTRDMGRWLPDGNIEYLGRSDEQVKIRGFRIEPGEIEHVLTHLPGIRHACVLQKTKGNGEKFLTAYVTSEEKLTVAVLRQQLSVKLPEYMIPSVFVQVESMPVTSSGKIDKKKLLALDLTGLSTGAKYEAPKNDIESSLVRLYEQVLQRTSISVRDNFFDLGGNSMSLIRLRTALERELGIHLHIRDLYRSLTIEELAETIATLRWMQAAPPTEMVEKEEEFLL